MTGFLVGLEHRAMSKAVITLLNGAYSLVKKKTQNQTNIKEENKQMHTKVTNENSVTEETNSV